MTGYVRYFHDIFYSTVLRLPVLSWQFDRFLRIALRRMFARSKLIPVKFFDA